jgi:TolB-like protein
MDAANTIPADSIIRQLKKVLDSPWFRSSPTLSKFLEFVTLETVQEKTQQIKEYSIAVNVLKRPLDFNPHDDAIVRIHAGRLRRALNEYYLIQGIDDPVIIRIPKGGYVPEFSENLVQKPGVLPIETTHIIHSKPCVAIFPFKIATHGENIEAFLDMVEGELSSELLMSHELSVIGYYSKEMKAKITENLLEAGKAVDANFIITGSFAGIGQHVHIIYMLLVTETGEVLLCRSCDIAAPPGDFFELHEDIIQNVIGFARACNLAISQEWQKRRH